MKKSMLYMIVVLAGLAGWNALASAEEVLSLKETASTLNGLAERAIDGHKGFKEAAENVKSPELKARFALESAERAKFAEQLKGKVKDLGEVAEADGTIEAAVHRSWIEIKSAVTKNDEKAILDAVKTGESEALDEYREALDKNLPEEARNLVEKQTKDIQSSYDWTVKRIAEDEAKKD